MRSNLSSTITKLDFQKIEEVLKSLGMSYKYDIDGFCVEIRIELPYGTISFAEYYQDSRNYYFFFEPKEPNKSKNKTSRCYTFMGDMATFCLSEGSGKIPFDALRDTTLINSSIRKAFICNAESFISQI